MLLDEHDRLVRLRLAAGLEEGGGWGEDEHVAAVRRREILGELLHGNVVVPVERRRHGGGRDEVGLDEEGAHEEEDRGGDADGACRGDEAI
eukprot:scaffold33644_cov63-Phaeocystis_antarctica.AAC.1